MARTVPYGVTILPKIGSLAGIGQVFQHWIMVGGSSPEADRIGSVIDADTKVMLAEVFYRRDDFQKAAAALNGVDVSSNKLIVSQYPALNAAKLESFKGQTPYEVQGNGKSTRLKFLKTDPLRVRVNGGDEFIFSSIPGYRRSCSTRISPASLTSRNSGLASAGVKLAESVIKQAGIKLEEDKASEGAGGGGG